MSLWLHAVAGGLEGVGASLTAKENEKRQMRGIQLREVYQIAREDRSRKFQSGEADKDRISREGIESGRRDDRRMASEAREVGEERRHEESQASRTLTMETADARHAQTMDLRNRELTQAATHFQTTQKRLEGAKEEDQRIAQQRVSVAAQKALSDLEEEGYEREEARREMLMKIYVNEDEVDVKGNPMPDMKAVGEAMAFYEQTGKDPWEYVVSAQELVDDVNETKMDLDEVSETLKVKLFRVPERSINRARKILGSGIEKPGGVRGRRRRNYLEASH